MTNRSMQALRIVATSICWLLAMRDLGSTQISNNQPQTFSGPYEVAGTVLSKIDGRPLAQARVVLANARNLDEFQIVITNDDGKFVFPAVPAGKYSLTGMKRGFIPAAYDQHDQFSTAIVTGAGLETRNLLLKLAPNAIIFGKILDEAGDPVRNATVTLYYDDHEEGLHQIRESKKAQTDDLGAYELPSLNPGTYYLSATATPWYAVHPPSDTAHSGSGEHSSSTAKVELSLDVAYPVTYYPDVTDTDSATPIPLRGGERMQIDIHLNPVPALRLLFRVPGDSQHGYSFPRFEQHSFQDPTLINAANAAMVSPGVIEVTGIPAGRYDVQLQGAGQSLQMSGIDLTNEGQEVDASAGEALSDVKVSVQAVAGTKLTELAVGLRSNGKIRTGVFGLNEKGEQELQHVAAGRYEMFLVSSGKPYSIARMSAEGAEVSGHTITIASGSSPSITLVVTEGRIVVEGVAKRAGKPFAGAMVVLVPKNVDGDRNLFRRDQSDLDGTFSLRDVTPGSYTLVAIENGWDLDWSQPGVIAVYAKHGRSLEVASSPGKPLRLDEPIEVVSK